MSKIDSMQELIDKLDLDNNASISEICDSALIVIKKLEAINSQEQFTLEEIKYLVSDWITKFGLTKVFQGYLDNFSEYFSSKFKAQTLFTELATQANKKIKQYEKNHRKIEQHHRLLCLALKAAKNRNSNGNYYTHYFRDNLTDLLVAETERVYDEINRVNDISDLDF